MTALMGLGLDVLTFRCGGTSEEGSQKHLEVQDKTL